jgi:hypothetical protein
VIWEGGTVGISQQALDNEPPDVRRQLAESYIRLAAARRGGSTAELAAIEAMIDQVEHATATRRAPGGNKPDEHSSPAPMPLANRTPTPNLPPVAQRGRERRPRKKLSAQP